jgi:hypothetical protein
VGGLNDYIPRRSSSFLGIKRDYHGTRAPLAEWEVKMPEPSLDLLMQMVQRVLDSQRETREDIREIKTRIGRLESEVANMHGFLAELSIQLDRRLEIADS